MRKTIAAVVVLIVWSILLLWPERHAAVVHAAGMSQLELRNLDIAFYERRAAEDPWSAADRAQLAQLYLQRAREGGDYEDFRRGERSSREALALRTSRNVKAQLALASSLLAQHRFAEAREAAATLVEVDPTPAHQALLAEIQLELGLYAAADSSFGALASFTENLAVAPRLARWHEIHGRSEDARWLLHESTLKAAAREDLPREQIGWFYLRVADEALRSGRVGEAGRAVKAGLSAEPGDHRLLAVAARIAAAKRDWKTVLERVNQVSARADMATLALAGDAAMKLGDDATAEQFYRRVERIAREQPEPFARQWTQFCLEHRLHLEETLRTLEADSKVRPDVLGYELLAWGYLRHGRVAEAHAAITRALALGTRDALLHYVAGEVEKAANRPAAARRHAAIALEINPRFHPVFADSARALLR